MSAVMILQLIGHDQTGFVRVQRRALIQQVIDDVNGVQKDDALPKQMCVYNVACTYKNCQSLALFVVD